MDGIPVTLDLVTPAYAGNATSGETDGLRPPVLKALLRFWWRTLYPHLEPDELFRREEQLFGSTRVGQGLRVVPCANPGAMRTIPSETSIPDAAAFLAYGVSEYARGHFQSTRYAVAPSTREQPNAVTFRLALPDSAPASATSEVVKALWLLSAFGGWGSKARRGWGSVHVECPLFGQGDYAGLADPHASRDRTALGQCLQTGLREALGRRAALSAAGGNQDPDHTAFSPRSRVFLGPLCTNPDNAMECIGSTYNNYRRALGARRGHRPGEVGPDHRLKSSWLDHSPAPGDHTPAGSAFGLPHFTRFSNGAQVNIGVGRDLNGRRASPVFFKVIRCGSQCVPVILWLPSLFLPGGDKYAVHVHVKPAGGGGAGGAPRRIAYGGDAGISGFLEGSDVWRGLRDPDWTEVEW